MIVKASKHLLKATEVMTWRSGVETYHVKILNGLIQSSQIFKQSPLFFIIQEYLNQRKAFLYLKALFGNNFH